MSPTNYRRGLMRSYWQPRIRCCSAASGRRQPGRDLVGRTAGASGIGGGAPSAGRRRAGQRTQSQPADDGRVCAADQQSDVGVRAWEHTAQREERGPSEKLCCECLTIPRHRSRLSHGTNRQTLTEGVGAGTDRCRRRARSVGHPAQDPRGTAAEAARTAEGSVRCHALQSISLGLNFSRFRGPLRYRSTASTRSTHPTVKGLPSTARDR